MAWQRYAFLAESTFCKAIAFRRICSREAKNKSWQCNWQFQLLIYARRERREIRYHIAEYAKKIQ